MQKGLTGQDLMDLGAYLQGLLVLMASDNHLHEKQKEMIRNFARAKGFEKQFIEESITNILDNMHIVKIPPKFNSKKRAHEFLREAAEISICDGLLHPNEKKWIFEVARKNNIEISEIEEILKSVPLSSSVPA